MCGWVLRHSGTRTDPRLAAHWPGRAPQEFADRLAGVTVRGVDWWIYPGESYADLTAAACGVPVR